MFSVTVEIEPTQISASFFQSYPEARPIGYSRKTLADACGAATASSIVILTSTGSPNLALAAAVYNVTTYLIMYKVKPRQKFHGSEVAVQHFMPSQFPPAEALPAPKPTLKTHPQYIKVRELTDTCFLAFHDVAPHLDDRWSGLDLVSRPLSQPDFPSVDAQEHGFTLTASKAIPGLLGVFPKVRLEEGSSFPVCAALFSTKATPLVFAEQRPAFLFGLVQLGTGRLVFFLQGFSHCALA